MGEFSDRRTQTQVRLTTLKQKLVVSNQLAKGKACVYVTGSFGRCEASVHSDLDIFIVSQVHSEDGEDLNKPLLRSLEDIRIKAELIEITNSMGIQEFSDDGRYLVTYSINQLMTALGKPEDDALNTFTARLLLLLESHPLVEEGVYQDIIKQVIGSYWKDFEDHKSCFVPAFLTNDILRLWRTLCVNYEANTSTEPTWKNAKRKLKNFKLKHSRLLTCYSAILYLLSVFGENKTVTQDDVIAMTRKTPVERLSWLLEQRISADASRAVNALLESYQEFLSITNRSEDDLINTFLNKNVVREHMSRANRFGELVFDVLTTLGDGNRLHRLVVV